jgi:hypothetical protein
MPTGMDHVPRIRLNGWTKAAIVLAGYLLAFAGSIVAVAIYDRRFTPADNQAMGGMIAGGETMYGLGMFAFLALAPTGLALWFLRGSRRFWSAFSMLVVTFAGVGLAAVVTTVATRSGPASPGLALFALLGIMQMLSSPLWIGGFAWFALIAPERVFRRRMLVAAAIEVAIAGCAVLHFLPAFTRG